MGTKSMLITLMVTGLYILSGILALDDVTVNVFGGGDGSKDVFPVAFTDYDGDKRTDLIVLTKNFSSFRIYFGSPNPPSLQYQPGFQCDIVFERNQAVEPVRITGLNVADFTGDGINDVMVSFKYVKNQSQDRPDVTFVSIFQGVPNSLKCQPLVLNGSTAASPSDKTRLVLRREPLIVDANGDMIADLVGETVNNERKVWSFRRDLSPPRESAFACGGDCLPIETGGFVDIDGKFMLIIIFFDSESVVILNLFVY